MKEAIISLVTMVLMLASCAAGGKNDMTAAHTKENAAVSSETVQSDTPAEEIKYPEIPADSEYPEAELRSALYSTGNMSRVKKAIEKAKSGGECTIAYIGGSITEGVGASKTGCYAAVSADSFKKRFGGSVNYINAGLSGTSSTLGMLRARRDVLDNSPDIVFVEFAVNDSRDELAQQSYESLIRTLLCSESAPAVVLIINRTDTGYNAGEHMKKLGEYYSLPVVSVTDAITPLIDSGKMSWSDYSADEAHPNPSGHKRIAAYIDYMFGTADLNSWEEYSVPGAVLIGAPYENAQLITPADTEKERIKLKDHGLFLPGSGGTSGFAESWHCEGTKPMKLTAEGRAVFVVIKRNNKDVCGTFEVYINGARANTISTKQKAGWGEAYAVQVIKFAEPHKMDIEIRPAEGEEKKSIDILGVAVS